MPPPRPGKSIGNPRLALQFVWVLLAALNPGCAPQAPKHGTEFVVVPDALPSSAGPQDRAQQLDELAGLLQRRLSDLRVRFVVEPDSDGQLLVRIPQVPKDTLPTLREVLSRFGRLEVKRVWCVAPGTIPPEDVPPTYTEMLLRDAPPGKSPGERYYVRRVSDLTNVDLRGARVRRGADDRSQIELQFVGEGEARFSKTIANLVLEARATGCEQRLAIVLDHELISVSPIPPATDSESYLLERTFTYPEAVAVATALNHPSEFGYRVAAERAF